MDENSLELWLKSIKQQEYLYNFIQYGYTELESVKALLCEEDLKLMGIDKPGAIKALLFHASKINLLNYANNEEVKIKSVHEKKRKTG